MLATQYPRTLERHDEALDSVALYCEILASAEPESVTIVVIGTMHNLSALLQSTAFLHSDRIDRHSNDQCALLYAIRGEGENFTSYLDGDIDLSKTGVCTWSRDENRRQGYIQKMRPPEQIAREIEQLMAAPRAPVGSPTPAAPTGVTSSVADDEIRLRWRAAPTAAAGAWIVGNRIDDDAGRRHTAYGLQFVDRCEDDSERTYVVRSIDAQGRESAGVEIRVAR